MRPDPVSDGFTLREYPMGTLADEAVPGDGDQPSLVTDQPSTVTVSSEEHIEVPNEMVQGTPTFAPGEFYHGDDGRLSIAIWCDPACEDQELWGFGAYDHLQWRFIGDISNRIPNCNPEDRDGFIRSVVQEMGFAFATSSWLKGRLEPGHQPTIPCPRLVVCHCIDRPSQMMVFTCWYTKLRVLALEKRFGQRVTVVLDVPAGPELNRLEKAYYNAEESDG